MEEYSNKDLVVPFYTQEQIENGEAKSFPFNDEYMGYDKRRHQYILTKEALIKYGIDLGDIQPIELDAFLLKVTRAVYSYIKVAAGKRNYPFMMFRIAKGWGVPSLSSLDFRTSFLEDIMIVQAEAMATGGYAKDMPKAIVTESGRTKVSDLSETDGYWLHDDVITSLYSLNLTNPQRIRKSFEVKWDEY